MKEKQTFVIFSEFGEISDVAQDLKLKGFDVLMHIPSKEYEKIGEGLVDHVKDWYRCIGEGYTWIFDSCSFGDLQDWLRSKGEKVFGGSKIGDELENNRQLNQKWFKQAGFYQLPSRNFKDIDAAIDFVRINFTKRWIMKQNGDAPKSLNHMAKFKNNVDLIFHLEEAKKKWNEAEWGPVDFDLMEVAEGGFEVAASAFWNGNEFLKDEEGKVCGFLNFEEKKEIDGGLGETTGEMGTTFYGTNTDNKLFRSIIHNDVVISRLRSSGFRGVFDINCIKTPKGIVALEPTMRPGIPASSYEFIEGLKNGAEVIAGCASGITPVVKMHYGWGMVMVIAAKPYPVEADMEDAATSIGEKLWPLNNGKPVKDFSDDQKAHIHLYNFFKDETGYRVATKNGYLLTVTGRGPSIKAARERLIDYIKENLYISGFKFRSDIGKRVEEFEEEIKARAVKSQELFIHA